MKYGLVRFHGVVGSNPGFSRSLKVFLRLLPKGIKSAVENAPTSANSLRPTVFANSLKAEVLGMGGHLALPI